MQGPDGLERTLLEQLLAGCAEALLVARTDDPAWPVVFANPAFDDLAGGATAMSRPLTDVIEAVAGHDLAHEVIESVRAGKSATYPVEIGNHARVLVVKPLTVADSDARYCAAYWRGVASPDDAAERAVHRELMSARRRIRDLSRDDPVTGLLNEAAFREVLQHDWAVAARERATLALISFRLDDFDAYLEVFGRPATDSCLRRVGQAIRRCLRRASDVAARLPGHRFVVLSHASQEAGVSEFADHIAATVRELGLHHPRSAKDRFVTLTPSCEATVATGDRKDADRFLERVING